MKKTVMLMLSFVVMTLFYSCENAIPSPKVDTQSDTKVNNSDSTSMNEGKSSDSEDNSDEGTDNPTSNPEENTTSDADWFVVEIEAGLSNIPIYKVEGMTALEYKKSGDADWTTPNYSVDNNGKLTITGLQVGEVYQIRFLNLTSIKFHDDSDEIVDNTDIALIKVLQWGTSEWTSMRNMFSNCERLSHIPETEAPKTSHVTDMSGMFKNCFVFNKKLPDNFDTSNVTNISSMFRGCTRYSQPLPESFDTSKVTDMNSLFYYCVSYNQPLPESFDTSNVIDMSSMFYVCSSYNQPFPSKFTTSNVIDMSSMFNGCIDFNQDISGWDVAKVKVWTNIFKKTKSLPQEYKPGKFR